MNLGNRKGGSMARGDSVTVSFRLNLNREEDMEIWSFLTGGAIEPLSLIHIYKETGAC